jgi:small subunit ribosomal protein S20
LPHHRSAIKRVRQDKKKRARNRAVKSAVKRVAKSVRAASTSEEASKLLPGAASTIDRAAKKHAIHWRTASRLKSRLAKRAAKPVKATA